MKTTHLLILLVFPLFSTAQTYNTRFSQYPLADKGETWLQKKAADSTLSLAISTLKNKPDPFDQRQAYYLQGRALSEKGNKEAAIPYLKKSIQLSQKANDEQLLLWSLTAISTAYGDKEEPDTDSSLVFLIGAQELAEKLKDTISWARVYIHRSNIAYLNDKYSEAVKYNYLCDTLLSNTNYNYEKGVNQHGIGNALLEIYINNENQATLNKCIAAYKNAVDIFKKTGDSAFEAHSRNSLAGAYLYAKDLDNASKETRMGIDLGKSLNDNEIQLNGNYNLSSLCQMNGDLNGAITALKELSLLLQESRDKGDAAFITAQYAGGQTDVPVALINRQIEILEKQVENERIKNTGLYAGIGLLFIIIVFIGLSVYYRQKSRLAAQRQKLLQKEMESVLQSQEIKFMRARFEGEEEGRHRIARQIHDDVGGLLVSAKWNLETALEELSSKETKVVTRLYENLQLQENSYKELRRIVYALEREDIPWWEDLAKFYQQISGGSATKIQFYPYNLDKRVEGKFGEEVRMIVQEIITNALKHAKATEINVQINLIDDELGVIIEDNGIGFDYQNITKGVGLNSIQKRCADLGGTVHYEAGNGTIVFIDIPLNAQPFLKDNPLLYAGTN